MSEITINPSPESTIGFKSSDFLCSPGFDCAPLGNVNEFSVDYTVIENMPIGPDGEPFVAIWGYPERAPTYARQGVQPIPQRWFKADFNGGKPLRATSPTVDLLRPDGLVYKEGGLLMAFVTTRENYDRLQENLEEAAYRAKYGKSRFESEMNAQEAEIAGLSRGTVRGYSEESFQRITTSGAPNNVPKKRGQVSLAGPKQPGL